MWSLKSPGKMVAIFCMNHGSVQFSLLFCHKYEQKTRKFKYLKSQWRGSAMKVTGLVRNELPQLNYYNQILTELYMLKSKVKQKKNIFDKRNEFSLQQKEAVLVAFRISKLRELNVHQGAFHLVLCRFTFCYLGIIMIV